MPEDAHALTADSRWPAFFPSSLAIVTSACGNDIAVERVVGATIVNRFPYVLALTVCREPLSRRHHVRRRFMRVFEGGGQAAVQFLPPGPGLDQALTALAAVPEDEGDRRLAATRLETHAGWTGPSPVFTDAYMVYEGWLAEPGRDFEGAPVFTSPWVDVGSHRLYFLEINAIALRKDLADGRGQLHWRSLPAWTPRIEWAANRRGPVPTAGSGYRKPYTPHYTFPSSSTAGFEADDRDLGMAIRHLPPRPRDQMEIDNDRARWPCFFPSSLGLITTRSAADVPNVMPCGSTMVVSRHPLVLAPCVSYAAINVRYAPRASLDAIRRTGRFGCGVPYIHERLVDAIAYAGNTSFTDDPDKVARAGLAVAGGGESPVLADLPIHFDCEVTGEIRMGTHTMFLGEARRILVREDVSPGNPLHWYPIAAVDAPVSHPCVASCRGPS
jgi:flavin reductase (DIM6/NTAB) family NADH-FMN oxidoreductase RutF